MTLSDATADSGWTVALASDIAYRNWVPVPSLTSDQERDEWLETTIEYVLGLIHQSEGAPSSESAIDVLSELQFALDERVGLGSLATFQIWPVEWPVSLLCHLVLVPGAYIPVAADSDVEIVAHPAASEHLGFGMQYTTRYLLRAEEFELVALEFVFSDGESSFVLTVGAAAAPLVGDVAPGVVAFKDSIRITRPDGSTFKGVPLPNSPAEEVWETEVG